MISVLVNGAKGKMGQATVAAVQAQSDLELVATCDVGDELAAVLKSSHAQVAVDFTRPDVVMTSVSTILQQGVHAVVGTTGLSASQLQTLDALAKSVNKTVLVAPNFAIGAVLMMQFAQKAAAYFDRAEIIEYHHDQKLDAPSGTALKTAEMIAAGSDRLNPELSETELVKGARGGVHHHIPIHSVRVPGVIANQDVIFGTTGQIFKLSHQTVNRESFMPGVILGIRKVMSLQTSGLIYGLENVL